ncbi:MAG: TonB family protein [Burkholderiales bacterium]|jgi:protein TonB|nr:TonB family protein [Burkholderiales bacterium]
MPSFRAIRLSKLQWALLISATAHAALLALKVGSPETFNRMFQDTPLSVVLVNQSSAEAPEKPQALAQVNLAGGGDDAKGLATTPLPATATVADGNALQNQSRSQLAQDEQKQRELITQVKSQMVQLQRLATQQTKPAAAQALEDQRKRLLDLLGAIERRIDQQNARPRRRFVGPNTRSVPYALYYDHMRQKIEHLGTVDFPQRDGSKLYGKLIMAITVDASGRLLRSEVVRGSGNPQLDRMARAIVNAAQPYGHFSAAMRRDADQLVIVAGFDFTREGGLETHIQAQPGHDGSPAP